VSKRKRIGNNRKKRNNKEIETPIKPFIIGFGIIAILIFLWVQFSYKGDINESELIDVSGKLNSELIKKYSGGRKFWIFLIKDEPIKFSICGNFNSKLFKSTETNESEITVKINKEIYEKSVKELQNKTVEIKSLSSNNIKYFDLKDYNEAKKSELENSYLFLIIGIGGIIYGLVMKK
jgi:hypothetical protein|tara:strand:+ start:89 stop:622 length:534 start_codon:yes stop_codon:yes gene_type:complete